MSEIKVLNIKPIGDRLYILPDAVVEKTDTGLYIPEIAQEINLQGTIVAKGDGMYAPLTGELIPMQTNLLDRVTYSPHVGNTVTIDGVSYLLVKETDLYAVI